MSIVKVLHDNYLDSEFYNGMTYSTQTTAAPASNVIYPIRRSKVWRTANNWVITSSNNVMKISNGVTPATVTVPAATYTSDTTFFAAMKTAFEAQLGGSTFTISRDTTTGKIKIAEAGAATFQMTCTDAASTLCSVIGFSTAADRTGALTYTADSLKIHTSEYIRFDMGTSVNPKAFVIFGPRNEPIKISATATIKLQGSSTDAWTSPEYSQTLTYGEYSIFVVNASGLHTQALRYWRVEITDVANPNYYIEISKLYLGDCFVPTRGAVQFPLREHEIDPSDITFGKNGTLFVDEIDQTSEISLSWNYLTVSEADTLREFIRKVGAHKPFAVILDPDAAFTTDATTRAHLVRFKDCPAVDYFDAGMFNSDWSLREEV